MVTCLVTIVLSEINVTIISCKVIDFSYFVTSINYLLPSFVIGNSALPDRLVWQFCLVTLGPPNRA